MTKEQKQLLLTDLCARLLCGIILYDECSKKDYELKCLDANGFINYDIANSITHIKPYLRPISSMTLEEECEFCRLFECDSINVMYGYINWMVGGSCDYDEFDIEFSKLAKVIDWLNEHHFDYRRLIEKGLALEAPEGMYN